ncbi:hypothetical protein YUYDRAFT_02130 [Streptomyces sp. ScaeMP-e48]|nr:hypothetical protein YUYDRAFT_02130 [Streptomyces sp. ScaeMP-e48]
MSRRAWAWFFALSSVLWGVVAFALLTILGAVT